jgi:hypothetical protein
MATWHQRQNPTPLWHTTKWTAVTERLNEMAVVSRWDTAKEANAHAELTDGYVIPPYDKEQTK